MAPLVRLWALLLLSPAAFYLLVLKTPDTSLRDLPLIGSVVNQIKKVIPQITDLSSTLGLTSINLETRPTIKEIQKNLETWPAEVRRQMMSEIPKQLPKIESILTNRQKEELFLKAAQSYNLPEIKVENFDQEITARLEPFEVKDTRESGSGWTLKIEARDLVGEKGTIGRQNLRLRLKPEHIEVLAGTVGDLTITENGYWLTVKTEVGRGRGHFKIYPLILIQIPQGSWAGSYQAEIESTLD